MNDKPNPLGPIRTFLNHLSQMDEGALAQLPPELDHPECLAIRDHCLRATASPSLGEGLSPELAHCLQGWSRYFRGEYKDAIPFFLKAWDLGQSWRSWSSLGMGKVGTDLGNLSSARDWLLEAMALARKENDLSRLCEVLGALGEVFFLAGEYQKAYELFVADAHLLNPGSGFRYRLNNYQAVTLGRLGCQELAIPIFWEAYYGALEWSPVSAWFSLAGLHNLTVLNQNLDLYHRLMTVDPPPPCRGSEWPRGFIAVGRAFWVARGIGSGSLAEIFQQALDCFGDTYLREREWVLDLMDRNGVPHERSRGRWEAGVDFPGPFESKHQRKATVFESVWREVPLPDDAWLPSQGNGTDNGETTWNRCKRFFI